MSENEPTDASDAAQAILQQMIKDAPEAEADDAVNGAETPLERVEAHPDDIALATGVPRRYRAFWSFPDDKQWERDFETAKNHVSNSTLLSLIGKRGSGKTRLAIEILRSFAKTKGRYLTAMDLFMRIRASYRKDAVEDESRIVEELSRCSLLILDEIQERGESAWEDRILTHLIDKRYSALKPTIIIANLKAEELEEHLGASASSRMREGGGILILNGKSHRG